MVENNLPEISHGGFEGTKWNKAGHSVVLLIIFCQSGEGTTLQ